MSTFNGLEMARRSLFISKKAMNITGHNIANANTPGFTRQSLILSSLPPAGQSGTMTAGNIIRGGAGAQIQQLRQIRDSFLDIQYRREFRYAKEWSTRAEVLSYIEDIFNEPSDTGLNSAMTHFFNGLQEMAKTPESIAVRTLVRQNAIKLTETIRHQWNQLHSLQMQQDLAIDLTVLEINAVASNIRDVNLQIFRFEEGGTQTANDLRDRRNAMLDQLSGLVNLSYYESDNGHFRIDIGGFPLVNHGSYSPMKTVKSTPNPADIGDLSTVLWRDTDHAVTITAGKLKGLLDMRDGITPDRAGIPYFMEQLNDLARALAQEFNRVHAQGYSIPFGDQPSKTGINFFSSAGYTEPADWEAVYPDWNSYTAEQQAEAMASFHTGQITAKNFVVDPTILDNVFHIAASSTHILSAQAGDKGNNLNILAMAALRTKRDIELNALQRTASIGSFEGFTQKMISVLAVETSHALKMTDNQTVLALAVENRRQSVSAVSIDEEMIEMIRFQHAFSAASRMVTAVDQMLETLILRTGVVGR